MRNISSAVAAVLLVGVFAHGQEPGSAVQTGDRAGDFVAVDSNPSDVVPMYWVNINHVHSIESCYGDHVSHLACLHMNDSARPDLDIIRVYTPPVFAQAVRAVLGMPNQTTPTATITVQAELTVGEPATLTANVVDPDYGDSWTYAWSVSTAARIAGEFSATDEATVEFTPSAAVETGLFRVVVTDHAGQSVTATSEIVRVQEPSGG